MSTLVYQLQKQGIFLNPEQVEAVRSIHGPHLILAGAGSGKTRVLASRTAYILTYDQDVRPNEILLLTFTRAAAKEMLQRIDQISSIGTGIANQIVSGTFHSVFLRMLRKHGYTEKILASEKQKEYIMKNILRKHRLDEAYEPETVLSLISTFKSSMLRPDDLPTENHIQKDIQSIYREYESINVQEHYMDFDDILLEAYDLLKNDEDFRYSIQSQFRYLCIDEYQDCNKIQHELISLMTNPEHDNVFFVGDEDQLIYGFRNSSPEYILNLEQTYSGLKKIILSINYRSTSYIVGLGNEIIKYNTERIGKTCKATFKNDHPPIYIRPEDTEQEALWTVNQILSQVNEGEKEFRDFGVLYRTNSLSRSIRDELVRRNIPFIVLGNDQLFYEQSLIKPVLAHLRLAVNPNDIESVGDIAPTLYISKKIASSHAAYYATLEEDKPALSFLLTLPTKEFQKQKVYERLTLIQTLKEMTPVRAIQYIRNSFYNQYLDMDETKNLTLHKEFLLEMLDELESSAKRFSTVAEYIAFIDLVIEAHKKMEELKKQENPNAVRLMTIHMSKGLEFDIVHILGFSDGILPHASATNAENQNDREKEQQDNKQALEEERRLAYVAVTRAKERLVISSPKLYRGKESPVSPFLLEAYQ
ncbi:ATP-dependent helicase [Pueribacillus sp. YX66]|uniref:ATP-dependent helicase n=1 Tax=Pueribacillus sp. YX66 TaxID=3229242 RepID=UPI00358D4CB4